MSSQQWKQQSGASRSRNVKATSVLFERSNFWQRGSKGYNVYDLDKLDSHLKNLRDNCNVGFVCVDDENFGSNKKYRNDYEPIDSYGFSPLSMNYTKSYLHHLFRTNEILGLRIATEHNLKFYIHLMSIIREEIRKNTFNKWAKIFIKRYHND